jgi:hypothetical protein
MTSALGVTVKSGWASVVVLSGPAASPVAFESVRIHLSDPAIPEARQPYHDGFGTARAPGRELSRLVASVRRFGERSVTAAIRRARRDGYTLHGAGIVVGSLIDPARLGNSHVRIHALEGQLFREVIADAAHRSRVRPTIWRERDLWPLAVGALDMSERQIRQSVAAMGRSVAGPWRAEQKHAALAAWLVLAGAPRVQRLRPVRRLSRVRCV